MNPLKPIAFAAILHCSIAAGSTWTPTSGPEGGRVTSLAHSGAQFYAGVGGVQRSGDAAATWTPASTGLPEGGLVTSIAASGDVVVAAIGVAGWIHDLATDLDIPIEVANPQHEGWRWNKVKRKTDRDDALKLARLAAMNQQPSPSGLGSASMSWPERKSS